MENAARTADIHDRILTFPDGLPLTLLSLTINQSITLFICLIGNTKQEGLAVASIAQGVGSSSTNRSSDIMH